MTARTLYTNKSTLPKKVKNRTLSTNPNNALKIPNHFHRKKKTMLFEIQKPQSQLKQNNFTYTFIDASRS